MTEMITIIAVGIGLAGLILNGQKNAREDTKDFKAQVNERLDQIDERFEKLDARFERLEARMSLISASELSSLIETAHLLSSPKNAERLATALNRAKAGTEPAQSIDDLRREVGLK